MTTFGKTGIELGGGGRMSDDVPPRVLPHPVRCEDCENSIRALRACRLDPLHGWPGVKGLGCLYWRERRDEK